MAPPIEILQSNRASAPDAYRAQRVETLGDDAYRQIEGLFVNGTLRPGSFVSEPQLQRLTSLGRAPVRDAVKRFEAERLLLPMHRKGIYVPALDVGDHLYLLEVRRPIEIYICRSAALRAQEAERAALRACIARFRDETGNWDHEVRAQRDFEYKHVIIRATRNPYIAPVIGPIHTLSRRFWHFHARFDGSFDHERKSDRVHVAVMEAICGGDPDEAEQAAVKCIDFLARTTRAILARDAGGRRIFS